VQFVYDAHVRLAREVLAQFDDTATARFDDVLARLPIDEMDRRELKYWQRQSLATVREFAALALPAALSAVATAQQDTVDAIAAAERSWAEVTAAPADTVSESAAPDRPTPTDTNGPALAAVVVATALDTADATDADHDDPDQADALELRRRVLAARLANGA
jgi:hypothetical protein